MPFEYDRPCGNIIDAVELRIQVKGRKPQVWRRVIVHPDTDLRELHRLISVLMEWDEGRDHMFKLRRDTYRPGEVGYKTRRISEFGSGSVISYLIDDGMACSVKVVRKDRKRSDRLPLLTAGMRTLTGGPDEEPYAFPPEKIETELKTFRRYDDLVPDKDGKMVELWRATALTRMDEPLDGFPKDFFGRERIEARLKAAKPLAPVKEKVPPNTSIELKITLKDMPVPVWRLVRVYSHMCFHDLHDVIQRSFGWDDAHLYAFTVGETYIQSFDEEDIEDFPIGTEVIDSRRINLRDIMTGKGWSIPYMYDFGDGWKHVVEVIKVHEGQNSTGPVELLDGSGACPPEDCGGSYAYLDLIDILNDPTNPEHDEIAEWFGADSLDPKGFDIEIARKKLRTMWWWLD